MKKTVALIALTGLITACTQTKPVAEPPATPTTPPVEQPYVQGELDEELLFALLAGEMAGHQQQFDLALSFYLEQAERTLDAAVAERATRIAQFIRKPEQTMKAASLWQIADSKNPEPTAIVTSLLIHQQQYEKALQSLPVALSFNDNRIPQLIRKHSDSIPAPLIGQYLKILDQHKFHSHPDFLMARAQLNFQINKPTEALQLIDQALLLTPQQLELQIQKAELLRQNNQLKQAFEYIKPLIKKHPDNIQLKLLYTQLLFQQGYLNEGGEYALSFYKEIPEDDQLALYLGLLLIENNLLNQAEEVMSSQLEQSENPSRFHFYLGYIAQQNGQTTQAIQHYQQIDDSNLYIQAAQRISILLNQPESQAKLSEIFQQARQRFPNISSKLYSLEVEWLSLHINDDEAIALIDQAIKEHPSNEDLIYTRALMIEPRDYKQTITDLETILSLNPNNSAALNALGYTLTIHTERYEEAYTLISKALEMRPNDGAVMDSMGWVLVHLNQPEKALIHLERAFKLIPEPEVGAHLIQLYWKIGRHQDATQLYEQLNKQYPEDPELQRAYEYMQHQK